VTNYLWAALLVFLLLLLALQGQCSAAITSAQARCIVERTILEIEMNPEYVWGAAKIKPGDAGDCSGKITRIFDS